MGIQLSPHRVSHICSHGHTGSIGPMDTCHTCSQPPLGSFSSFIFKAGTVSSLYVCEVLSTTRLGPQGTIMTINNHNSGVRHFQIPNLHSSALPTAHTYTHPPFSVSEFDLCSCSELKSFVSGGAHVRRGIPGEPARAEAVPVPPGGTGRDGRESVHTLSAGALIWTHPPVAGGNHRRRRGAAERGCAEPKRQQGTSHVSSSVQD